LSKWKQNLISGAGAKRKGQTEGHQFSQAAAYLSRKKALLGNLLLSLLSRSPKQRRNHGRKREPGTSDRPRPASLCHASDNDACLISEYESV